MYKTDCPIETKEKITLKKGYDQITTDRRTVRFTKTSSLIKKKITASEWTHVDKRKTIVSLNKNDYIDKVTSHLVE